MQESISHIEDGDIKMAFIDKTVNIRIDQLIPSKPVATAARHSRKYQQIITSIKALGIIEPPVVTKESDESGLYIILDGHLRVEALRELGEKKLTCLISTDDESFTYNRHIGRLSTIQEHRMIVKAIERGVAEERIAIALGVDVKRIVERRNLLSGICAEAAELLKDKHAPIGTFRILKKMTPIRQIQAATLMNDAGTYSISYARVLWTATPKDQLVDPAKTKKVKGLSEEQMDRMETEMANLEREYQLVEESYGKDVLNLTLAKGYLSKLLGNARVVNYLATRQPDIYSHFQKIASLDSLDEAI